MNTPETLHLTAELDDTVVLVSPIPSYVRSYAVFNPGTTGVYLFFYDVATATEGAIVATLYIPAGGGANLAGLQWRFVNGIAIAASNEVAALDPPANSIVVNVGRG
jgi:hypothetical protein